MAKPLTVLQRLHFQLIMMNDYNHAFPALLDVKNVIVIKDW